MTKIWGIGLPRTGTTSLAEALNLLGFKTTHYCKLQSGDSYLSDILEQSTENDAVVNNHLCDFYKRIYALEQMDEQIGLYVVTYRLDKYVLDNLNYLAETYSFFEERGMTDHLLLLDANSQEKEKWSKLSLFLGKDAPSYPFPHLNKGCGI
jgi:hypothetical protein